MKKRLYLKTAFFFSILQRPRRKEGKRKFSSPKDLLGKFCTSVVLDHFHDLQNGLLARSFSDDLHAEGKSDSALASLVDELVHQVFAARV